METVETLLMKQQEREGGKVDGVCCLTDIKRTWEVDEGQQVCVHVFLCVLRTLETLEENR